jgi:uroporphyrinogen-III synthase
LVTRVWITRAQPGAAQTAEYVRALGAVALVAPVLEARSLAVDPTEFEGAGALAFTSANGVRAFAAQSDDRRRPVFAVGDATAVAARGVGFTNVMSAAGDVAALARLITRSAPLGGPVLHIGAQEPAGDLAAALAEVGIAARRIDIYRTITRQLTDADLTEVRTASEILVHSPRAAAVLRDSYADALSPRACFLCLSPAVAEPLKIFKTAARIIAGAPNEPALIAELANRLTRG